MKTKEEVKKKYNDLDTKLTKLLEKLKKETSSEKETNVLFPRLMPSRVHDGPASS